MVGVPGRSGGCHTCRRRKIKCDRSLPCCRNCIQSTRQCEGYDTFPVFLNRTAAGLQKRHRLDEARLQPVAAAIPTWSAIYARSRSTLQPGPPPYRLSERHVSLGPVQDRAYLDHLCQHHLPQRRDALDDHWLWLATRLNNPGPALTVALRSLSLSHIGTTYDDETLRIRAKELHGSTLKILYQALSNPKAAPEDVTILMIRIVTFFELLDAKREFRPWVNHQKAVEQLIHMNGPRVVRSPIGKALFEQTRRSAFCRALVHSEHTFFEDEEWQSCDGDLTHQLFDMGFTALRICIEIQNTSKNGTAPFPCPDFILSSLRSCQSVLDGLESWHKRRLSTAQGPLFWNIVEPEHVGAALRQPVWFPSYNSADITIHFWTILVMLGLSIGVARACATASATLKECDATIRNIKTCSGGLDVEAVSKMMIGAVPFFLQEGMGRYAVIRVAWSVGIAARAADFFQFPLGSRLQDFVIDNQRALAQERLLMVPFDKASRLLDAEHQSQLRGIQRRHALDRRVVSLKASG